MSVLNNEEYSVGVLKNSSARSVREMPEMVEAAKEAPTEVKNAMWDAEPEKKKKGEKTEELNDTMTEETLKKYQLEDEVINIPTLEAKIEEAMLKKVSDAPIQDSREIQSFKELERKVFDASSLNRNEDGLDMTLLTGFLVPPEQCFEGGEEWNEKTFLDLIPRTKVKDSKDDEEKKKKASNLEIENKPQLTKPVFPKSSSKDEEEEKNDGVRPRGRRRGRERKRVKIRN